MIQGTAAIEIEPTVPVLLQSGVERFGDDDYIVMADRRLTFRDAERQSRALAKEMIAAGAGKGTRVGIFLPSSPEFAVAFLACARIGAIAAHFSSTYRPAELHKALRLADIQFLITRSSIVGRNVEDTLEEAVEGLSEVVASPYRLTTLPFLREIWMWGGSQRRWARTVMTSPEDTGPSEVSDDLLAAIEGEVTPADHLLIIWTSGSSADPKGVVHTHGGAVRKVSPTVGLGLQASRPGVVFMAMPFFWVGGPQSVLGCLFSGAKLVCQERFEAAGAIELIERERCTTIGGWASMLESLRSHPDWATRDTSSIEAMPTEITRPDGTVARVVRTSSKGHSTNLGMTETFGPHANPQYFDYKVIDRESGAVLPDGEIGEFCVRGFGLMAGMYKKEREEVFDDDGYYHTGDRGYIENGSIYFTGRYSEMIKSQGANVSPLEVESILLSFPEINQAFVFGVSHPQRGEEVTAILIPSSGFTVDVADIRQRTSKLLSGYKIPTRFEVIDAHDIPTLSNGKPDKRAMRTAAEARVSETAT